MRLNPQGFEDEYASIVRGPDFVWRGDRWEAHPEASFDTQVKRGTPEPFDPAVRNTYKVLLTRWMRGTVVYSTDNQTQELPRSLGSQL